MWSVRLAIAMAGIVATASPGHAAQTIFLGINPAPAGVVSGDPLTARNAFLAALDGSAGTESFEGVTTGTTPTGFAFAGSAGTITASFQPAANSFFTTVETAATDVNGGRFATSGSRFLRSDSLFSLGFDTAVAAFGFFGTDFGDFNGLVTLSLLHANGTTTSLNPTLTPLANGSLLFFGVVDAANPFTRVTFSAALANGSPSSDLFGFDDFIIADAGQLALPGGGGGGGAAIPEPATWAMLIAGFALAGASIRRSRSRESRTPRHA